ncbi:MAG: sugar ABC transporter permease [Acidimicrobiia bacterium]|nr:sugar ABC transporter permease [Acidimicrobiia bacterium]
MYGVFVLQPLFLTIQYSFYSWDGITAATWVGFSNYARVFTDADLLGTIFNSFRLLVFFSLLPVGLGLVTASLMHRVAADRFGSIARSVIFLPQVIPLVAAGIIWRWLLSLPGLVNQVLDWFGLGGIARAWLGDFDTALPAVGMIGVWVLLGFCTVLLQTGMAKINPELYEAARLDGAGWWAELRAVTIPGIRYELGVCLTVTAIAALAAFDIVYVSTGGGPGRATSVPGIKIYIEAFLQRRVGLASALAVVLMCLVLAVILPIQRLSRETSE